MGHLFEAVKKTAIESHKGVNSKSVVQRLCTTLATCLFSMGKVFKNFLALNPWRFNFQSSFLMRLTYNTVIHFWYRKSLLYCGMNERRSILKLKDSVTLNDSLHMHTLMKESHRDLFDCLGNRINELPGCSYIARRKPCDSVRFLDTFSCILIEVCSSSGQ